MTPAELRETGAAIFGGAHGWQTALARILDVHPRRIRAWLAGENAVPAGVASQVRAIHTASGGRGEALPIDTQPPELDSPPEWIIGTEAPGTDETADEYLIHTRRPRFIARIGDEVTRETIIGREVHATQDGAQLAVTWLDRRPNDDEVRALIRRAFDAL